MQNYNYSLSDLADMLPWEREVYVSLLTNQLKLEREMAKGS